MTNQNECDHVVTVHGTCWNGADLVTLSEVLSMAGQMPPNVMLGKKFNFCPSCGAKVDWAKIKEACDAEDLGGADANYVRKNFTHWRPQDTTLPEAT